MSTQTLATTAPSTSSAQRPLHPPSAAQIQAKLDLVIAIALFSWPALTVAVQNDWGGGGQSAEKREWFAGAVSDLLAETPSSPPPPSLPPSSFSTTTTTTTLTSSSSNNNKHASASDIADEVAYLEEFLLRVMDDEFETRVEDDSAEEVAWRIIETRQKVRRGDFAAVDEMLARYEARRHTKGGEVGIVERKEEEHDEDTDGESIDDETEEADESEEDGDGDVDMDLEEDASSRIGKTPREKPAPEVDEDGFIKVAARRKR